MSAGAADVTIRVRIRGRVQGVWFRAWTAEQASERALHGWVRNRRDGSVEAVFRGPAAAVREMIAACWRGPPAARVEAIEESAADPYTGTGFITLSTE
jgi:acylphosphatase